MSSWLSAMHSIGSLATMTWALMVQVSSLSSHFLFLITPWIVIFSFLAESNALELGSVSSLLHFCFFSFCIFIYLTFF